MIQPHIRNVIAAASISHASGKSLSAIYKYGDDSGFKTIAMKVANGKVTGYDYTTSSHFTGTMPNLYHYGESCHVQLQAKGNGKYAGFVYGGGGHFEVTVKGKNASFYDYGGSGWTQYSV